MSVFTSAEILELQTYLQAKFGNKNLEIKARQKAKDSLEVTLSGEFIGTIYKDTDDGETSYDFNMAILDIDLKGEKAA